MVGIMAGREKEGKKMDRRWRTASDREGKRLQR